MSISSKYGYKPDHEAIARHLDLIAGGLEEIATEELYKMLRHHGPDDLGQ